MLRVGACVGIHFLLGIVYLLSKETEKFITYYDTINTWRNLQNLLSRGDRIARARDLPLLFPPLHIGLRGSPCPAVSWEHGIRLDRAFRSVCCDFLGGHRKWSDLRVHCMACVQFGEQMGQEGESEENGLTAFSWRAHG